MHESTVETRNQRLGLASVLVLLLGLLAPQTELFADAGFPMVQQVFCDPAFGTCPPGCVGPECPNEFVEGLGGAHDIAISPDDKHVYLVSGLDDALLVFSRDAQSGRLVLVESHFDTDPGIDGLQGARGVAVSPDGNHVYVTAWFEDALSAWSRDAVTGALTLIEVEKDGVAGADGLNGATDVALSPDGAHVYVASRTEGAVAVYSRSGGGQVALLEVRPNGGDGAEGIAVSGDGAHVYVACDVLHAVRVFSRETNMASANYGKLTFMEVHTDGSNGVDGLARAATVVLDPNGENVYVGSEIFSDGDDWAAVFQRNDDKSSFDFGKLTFVQDFQESDFGTSTTGDFAGCFNGSGPDHAGLLVTPDGSQVYLTNALKGIVAVFTRSGIDGSLSLADFNCARTDNGLGGTAGLAMDSGGKRAYTVAPIFLNMATLCTDTDDTIDLADTGTVAASATVIGCRSITAGGTGAGYVIDGGADVVFQTPRAVLTDGFAVVDGTFLVASAAL